MSTNSIILVKILIWLNIGEGIGERLNTSISIYVDIFIPQFDHLSLGAQMFGVLPSFCLYYVFHMKKTLPGFVEIKKLRNKKIYSESSTIEICSDYTSSIRLTNYINYKNLI